MRGNHVQNNPAVRAAVDEIAEENGAASLSFRPDPGEKDAKEVGTPVDVADRVNASFHLEGLICMRSTFLLRG